MRHKMDKRHTISGIMRLAFSIGIFLMVNVAAFAQTPQESSPTKSHREVEPPKKAAFIDRFDLDNEGTLHIIFSDRKDIHIPKEQGRFGINQDLLEQVEFEKIRLAEDRHHIGWLASYMICQQSYSCTPELAIFHAEQNITYITPPHGVMWDWKFVDGGKHIVIQYGFPHGDEGAFALFETETGNKLAEYSAKDEITPKWVQQFLTSDK